MNIKEIRNEFKLSQIEFAKLLGTARQTIVNWEKGEKIPDSKIQFISTLVDKLRRGDSTDLQDIFKGNIAEPSEKYRSDKEATRYVESLERIIKSKDEQIKLLNDNISFLKSLIEKPKED